MSKSVAIKYTHFVATNKLNLAAEWAEHIASGDYVIDNGTWRNHNPRECKGIEFEFEHDATAFILRNGGMYEKRSPGKDSGINH
jgi:hypothetical protein